MNIYEVNFKVFQTNKYHSEYVKSPSIYRVGAILENKYNFIEIIAIRLFPYPATE
jgi:hypothetical protein